MNRIVLQHVKSGGFYEVMGPAKLEATGQELTIYRSMKDGAVWARPTAEFADGRFVLAATQTPRPNEPELGADGGAQESDYFDEVLGAYAGACARSDSAGMKEGYIKLRRMFAGKQGKEER